METRSVDKKAMYGLSAGHFMIDWFASLLIPLYPVITAKLGISLSLISTIIALGHMLSSMLQPLFGFISDKMRHRTFMFWGLVMSSVFIPMTVVSDSAQLLALFLIIGMCGNALFHPQVTGLINTFTYNNPQINKYMGIFLGLGTFGYAISPTFSSYFLQNFGENSLLLFTIPGLIVAFVLLFATPKIPYETVNKQKQSFFGLMKEILSSKPCLGLILIAVVKSGVSISFGTYAPFILHNHGFSTSQTGIITTIFLVAGGISTILSPKIEDKIGGVNVIRLSFFTILPMTLAFLLLLDFLPTISIICFILAGFAIMLSVSVTIVAAQKLMSKSRGVISGVMQGFSWGLGALFLAPLGYFGQHFGVEKILILMALIAFLTGAFGITKELKEIFKRGV